MYSKSTGKNKELSYISLAMKGLQVYGTIVYQYFLRSYTETALSFTLAGDGGSYIFTLPRLKFGSGAPEVSGTGPVVLNMDFQALFDTATATNLKIERNAT